MKTLKEYIEESLFKHIAIELKNEDIIYEKYGEYDGCNELAKYIANLIYEKKSDIDLTYNDVCHIENIVFDKMHIRFKEGKEYAEYIIENTGNISDTGRLSYVEIYIQNNSHNIPKLTSMIEHELMHIYNDYMLYQKGIHTFLELFSSETYKKYRDFNSQYYHTSVRELKLALYLLNEYEKNAFIAQLCSEIKEIKAGYPNNALNANKMYDIVRTLDIWKAYWQVGKFIERHYRGKLTNKENRLIHDAWKDIFNEDIDIDKIFKKLEKKFIKTKNKIESIVVKKIAEEHNINKIVMDGIDITDLRLK